MKRKWICLLAALPLVIGLVVARRSAGEPSKLVGKRPQLLQRPRLVARGLDFSDLVISPTGEKAVVRGNYGSDGDWSRIVNLKDGSKISASGGFLSHNTFSADGKKICQLTVEAVDPTSGKYKHVLVLSDASTGKIEENFHFTSDADFYGVWRDGDEIVVESLRQTWRFEARTLRLISTQKQRRTRNAKLCPDGKTLYWEHTTNKMGVAPLAWSFADIDTGKILWSDMPVSDNGGPTGFSVDGRIVLWKDVQAPDLIIARDTRTGSEKWRLRGPQSSVVALSPDGKAVYEVRENGELWKWSR